MTLLRDEDQMYAALVASDPEADGAFLVAVKTTGIFCRPTCPARKPLRKNVEFFFEAREALHAGYRPCKRCRPLDRVVEAPNWVKMLLQRVDECPGERLRDHDLRKMNIEPSRARRYFKTQYGMTFQGYCRARRMGLALKDIREGQNLVEVGMDAGYDSLSGFRDAFEKIMGEVPGRSGATRCHLARWIDSPLGALLAVANDEGLCLLEFVDRRMLETQIKRMRTLLGAVIVPGDNEHLDSIQAELARYFAGELRTFTTPLVLKGSPFQEEVWRTLLEIPYGETRSYSWLADRLGREDAQRAVGRANGDNRLAIIVPCHRVIKSNGELCGYGGGIWRKQWLLALENGQPGLL